MRILLVLIFAPLIALALMYFIFPGRLVALGRALLRRRGGMVQKSVAVDGRIWPYLEGGDPSKPLLLLVHGFAGDKDNWSMIAPYLTRDYHVIAPDLPGLARMSAIPTLPMTSRRRPRGSRHSPTRSGSSARTSPATAWAAGSRCATRSTIRTRSPA